MSGRPYPRDDVGHARVVDARLHLLDRQVLDLDGTPVTVVDDIELTNPPRTGTEVADTGPADAPRVVALLSGSLLNTRLLGGHQPASRWNRVPWDDVAAVGVVISLAVRGDALDVTWPERWLREHLIGRIPGGRHDPQ